MGEAQDPVRLIDCPSCGKPLALLSIEQVYPGLADVESSDVADLPGEIRDLVRDEADAKFAILDREGQYTCPWCNATNRLGQE
jgi:hypothetical protein